MPVSLQSLVEEGLYTCSSDRFCKYHATLGKLTLDALKAKLKDILLPDSSEHSLEVRHSRLSFISAFFEHRYGSVMDSVISAELRRPPMHIYASNEIPGHVLG
jgi:hypothetical protein